MISKKVQLLRSSQACSCINTGQSFCCIRKLRESGNLTLAKARVKLQRFLIKINYKLPPRADNKITTNGPAETTKTKLTRVRANSIFIKIKKTTIKNQKVTS